MAHPLSEKTWQEIRTKYALGMRILHIAKEYKISDGTIHNRIKKEGGWDKAVSAQVTELKRNIAAIEKKIETDSLDSNIVQEVITETVALQRAVSNFVKGAVNLNVINLRDTLAEKDPFKRIIMTNKMRATMADVAGISINRPQLPSSDNPDDKTSDGVVLYLPDNGR